MNPKDDKPRIAPWTPATRFIGWRPRDPKTIERTLTRPGSKDEARERTRVRIPADHPDIPF
jgi:hypothetical protein